MSKLELGVAIGCIISFVSVVWFFAAISGAGIMTTLMYVLAVLFGCTVVAFIMSLPIWLYGILQERGIS